MQYNGQDIILSTQLKNAINKLGSFEFYLKNIDVNGAKRGCSGFIKNPVNNTVVYVNTERATYSPLNNKAMYRYARDLKDYSSNSIGIRGINRWCQYDKDILAKCIVELLTKEDDTL